MGQPERGVENLAFTTLIQYVLVYGGTDCYTQYTNILTIYNVNKNTRNIEMETTSKNLCGDWLNQF